MGWELVARTEEIDRGLRALSNSRLVAFTGSPGVGKSRLLDEVVGRFEAPTRPVFRALATPATRTIPLSPFITLLPAAPPPDPSLLLAAIVGAIDAAGDGGDLVLAIDDAHHLDDASLALLSIILTGATTRIALTASDDHDWTPAFAALLRDDRSTRIDVGPLGRDDFARLVDDALGSVDDHLGAELWRLAQGNPLVMREVLDGAADRLAQNDDGRWTANGSLVSARLVDLARSRLARLRPEVSDALALVAVGAPIPYEVLASALPVDTLDELTTTNLAQIATVGPTTVVRPAHPLYGEVLIAGLGGQRLRGIHSALVAAAATAPEAIDPLRVAVWQQRAGVDPDPMIALNGVQAALARHDGALAASLLDPVVDRIDPSMASLLTGASLVQQGRFEEAESAFAKAPPHSDSIHTHSAVEIASARAFNMAFGLRRPADAGAMLAALADEVDDPVERGRLDSERGVIAGIDGDFTLALAAATRTVANPAARGPALASAYVSLTLTESMLARCTDIEEHSWAGVAVAADCASALPLARAQILTMLTIGLVSSGEIDRARALAEAEVADDPQLTLGLWEMTLGMVLCQEGRLDDAAEETRRALGRSELTGLLDLRGMASGLLAAIEGQTGRADGWAQLDELRERHGDPRNAIWLDRGRAWTRAASGDLHGAVEIVVDGGRQALDNDHIAWGVLELHDAVRMSTHATVDPTVVDDLRGAVATTEGAALLDTVVRHGTALAGSDPEQLMSVAVAFAAAGSAIFAAEAAAHAASIHAARSETSAASRATTLSAAWHSQCRSARTPALLGRPDLGLSSRELEIALDAARGDTSADIAQSRFISVRTVDNHLGSAYRTLEASGRAELAEVLAPVLRFSLDHTDDE